VAETSIEWTATTAQDGTVHGGYSFNAWVGCQKISVGPQGACENCYAESWAKRTGQVHLWQGERRRTTADYWKQPIKWNAKSAKLGVRLKVFCCSLADVFDNEVPQHWRTALFALIHDTPNLDWLLLTKRIGNAARMLAEDVPEGIDISGRVWLGATIANQAEADRDIPKLLATPARLRFLSCEPLLGPIDLTQHFWGTHQPGGISWLIAGGESGSKARPSHPDWFRSLRDQCADAGVAYHHKQHGEWIEAHERTGELCSDEAEYEQMAAECDGFISLDGRFVRSLDDAHEETRYRGMKRVGKKAAGRTLDGKVWDEFPTTARDGLEGGR